MASEIKTSFQSKEQFICPVCGTKFHREELLSGSGRLIAGALTEELHRLYEPSAKYGTIYPLAYLVTVCPDCFFAAMDKDFQELPTDEQIRGWDDTDKRKEDVNLVFPGVDFRQGRSLFSGAASQYLAVRCYDFYPQEFSPTIKQGMSAIRTAWLLDDLHKQQPGENYDWLATLFRKKAQFFYSEALKREQSGEEPLGGIKNMGPDTDKNYGYEGVLYLSGWLRLKFGPRDDQRAEALGDIKRTIAKIFGFGRSSKQRPGPLLELARNLYNSINRDLNEADDV
ncbi:membrane protein [Spirochaetia bacterium]|nr:membrane protein [Spirochaetia bacterium]